jgi:hypothetical protein
VALFHEYALLIAVALPVVVVAALNVWLALRGERDTLLLPVPRAYPTVASAEDVGAAPAIVPLAPAAAVRHEEPLRHAA